MVERVLKERERGVKGGLKGGLKGMFKKGFKVI